MPRSTLKLGARDNQDILVWQRFVRVTEDGFFGPQTEEATMRFQYAHGLTADGIVGPKTWAAMDQEAVTPKSLSWGSMFGADTGQITLAAKKTPLTAEQAAMALAAGYKQVTGRFPTVSTLGFLIAQTALETGNWNSLWNYNFGNAKATKSDPYVQFFRCSEVINGKEVFFDPPHPTCKFVAHKDAADGAAHYVRVLAKRPHWWAGLHSGSVESFINGLTTAPKYFTASPSLYLKGMQRLTGQYSALAQKYAKSNWLAAIGVVAGVTGLLYIGNGLVRHG
jgi:hypothetical protein